MCLAVAVPLAAGEKATPEEAQALLAKAVTAIETQGEVKALALFNDPKGGFRDRELYVFCLGPDNKITAALDPKLIGVDEATIKDADGKEIGKEMAALRSQGEGSVEYRWMNPVSGKVETKTSFLKRAGAQFCGVGAYK
jgi:signal transduction histidine kinase